MILNGINIRHIQPSDNKALANIVRTTMSEFGVDKPGTVFYDATTDALYELFQTPGSTYFVAEENGVILGGAGISPSDGLPPGVCELVKIYLLKSARGSGLGRLLIDKAIEAAIQLGYKKIYLESFPELKKAISVYEKFGFKFLNAPMGNTGHFACDVWMLKDLEG